MAVAGIAREVEIERLRAAGQAAAEGHGSVIFLAGPNGSGKTFLLDQFATGLADANLDVVRVACYVTGGPANPLGPFIEGLRALTNEDRRGPRAKRIVEILGKLAPLLEVIPVGGAIASKVVEAGAGVYAATRQEEPQTELAGDVARVLQRAAQEAPLVVIVDDAQWIDPSSTEVIVRLAATAPAHPLLLVVAYDTNRIEDRHPLALVRAETVGRGLAAELALGDLSVDGVRAFLLGRYGSVPAGRLAEWLHDRTEGNPRFLTQYLERLEEAGILRREGDAWTFDGSIEGEPGGWSRGGRLAEIETPRNLLELLRPRIAALDEDEFSLLQAGAVQGRRFLSAVLVRLLDREENEIFARLHTIVRRRRMIEAEGVEGWWSEKSAQYTFDPGLLQELLYDEGYRDPYERRRGHAAVAGALEALIADEHSPPRHALLEIAAHYEQAGKPLEAAAKLIEVADSTFAERADRETGIHATRALALLRKVQPKQPTDDAGTSARRLVARAILLLLIGGEVSWTAYATSAEGERLIELAEEGERVATELGDDELRVNALYAKANVQTICGSLHEALGLYQDALDGARAAGDRLAEFSILVTYGHQLDSVDLRQGLKLLEQARELLVGDALRRQLDERRRASQMALIESRLGVAAFDLGRYGEALDLLTRSSVALREFRNHDERAWSLVFLAQLQTAVGLCEAAEATIRDALDLFADDPRPLGVRGYLYSLLGRLYLEWDPPKLNAAREALLHARVEARESGHRTVMPFADIFWAALLFAEGTPEKLREADDVLAAVTSFGWERSEITARSLRARIALAEGRTGPALELSTQAVTPLEKRGDVVPTVRAEEIYFTHARALEAANQEQAEQYYQAASRVVRGKIDSLHDAAQRDSFQRRVRVSREILAARPGGL